MNSVAMIGRIARDPEVRYSAGSQTAVARFSIAINRGKDNKGNDLGADYPSIVCFGKTAELVEKYLGKGRLVGITGRIQTGSYEKDGVKHYTTDVVAERVEFLDKAKEQSESQGKIDDSNIPEGFSMLTDDDIPFDL